MKSSFALIAFGVSGLASAAICNNNCGRAVIGTAGKQPVLASRKEMCSAFLATTTTVTPG